MPDPQLPIMSPPISSLSAERERIWQQYCSCALALQQGARPPHPKDLACPNCPWGRSRYPPNSLTLSSGRFVPSPLEFEFIKHGEGGKKWQWRLPHRFFLKSHLKLFKGVHDRGSYGYEKEPSLGCLLCERKGVLTNFTDWRAYGRHIEGSHGWIEYGREPDIVSCGPMTDLMESLLRIKSREIRESIY